AEAACAYVDGAAGNDRVLVLQRLYDLLRDELQLRHARQVEGDAQLARRVRPGFGCTHAVEGLDRILQLARVVLELTPGRLVRDQRELHDVDQSGIHLAHVDLDQLGGQTRTQRADFAHDFVVLLL